MYWVHKLCNKISVMKQTNIRSKNYYFVSIKYSYYGIFSNTAGVSVDDVRDCAEWIFRTPVGANPKYVVGMELRVNIYFSITFV